MTPAQQNWHRWIWLVLAPLTAAGVILALWAREAR
jgi:hypothetical protein